MMTRDNILFAIKLNLKFLLLVNVVNAFDAALATEKSDEPVSNSSISNDPTLVVGSAILLAAVLGYILHSFTKTEIEERREADLNRLLEREQLEMFRQFEAALEEVPGAIEDDLLTAFELRLEWQNNPEFIDYLADNNIDIADVMNEDLIRFAKTQREERLEEELRIREEQQANDDRIIDHLDSLSNPLEEKLKSLDVDVPIEYLCPISRRIIASPVKLQLIYPEDLSEKQVETQYFDEEFIKGWLTKSKTCPLTGLPVAGYEVDQDKLLEIENWVEKKVYNATLQKEFATTKIQSLIKHNMGMFKQAANDQEVTPVMAFNLR